MHRQSTARPSIFDTLGEKHGFPVGTGEDETERPWRVSGSVLAGGLLAGLALTAVAVLTAGSSGPSVAPPPAALEALWPRDMPAPVVLPEKVKPEKVKAHEVRPAGGSRPPVSKGRRTLPYDDEPLPPPERPPIATASPRAEVPSAVPPRAETPPPAIEYVPAVKVYAPRPELPEGAPLASGTAVLEASVDAAGTVTSTRVLRSAGPALDAAASAALERWLFQPATIGGEPAADVFRTAFNFRVQQRAEVSPAVDAPALPAPAPPAPTQSASAPVRLYAPPPVYPQDDWVAGRAGDVKVRATVGVDGRVTAASILEGVSPGLDRAVLAALGQWRFRPAVEAGEPVVAESTMTFRFSR